MNEAWRDSGLVFIKGILVYLNITCADDTKTVLSLISRVYLLCMSLNCPVSNSLVKSICIAMHSDSFRMRARLLFRFPFLFLSYKCR